MEKGNDHSGSQLFQTGKLEFAKPNETIITFPAHFIHDNIMIVTIILCADNFSIFVFILHRARLTKQKSVDHARIENRIENVFIFADGRRKRIIVNSSNPLADLPIINKKLANSPIRVSK